MSDLKPGSRVTHKIFGTGTVRHISGSGPSAKITVDFSANVGQKKLIASVANLVCLDPADDESVIPRQQPPPVSHWYEVLEADGSLIPGRRPPADKLHAALRQSIRQPEFWVAVREQLRPRGIVPRVVDEPNGRISLTVSGMIQLRIVVQHAELVRESDAVLARALFELLQQRHLIDFQNFQIATDVRTDAVLDEPAIEIGEPDPGELPDRAPRRRALPVTPKGVIQSRPKRDSDY